MQSFYDYMKILHDIRSTWPSVDSQLENIDKNLLNDLIYCSQMKDDVDKIFTKKLIHQIIVDKVYTFKN